MKTRKIVLSTLSAALLLGLCACGMKQARAADKIAEASIEAETTFVTTESIETTAAPAQTTVHTTSTEATTETETETTTVEATESTSETATEPEDFELTDEKVAAKMFDFFSEKGYSAAQIAGIIGNAEIESGLEPSRGVPGGGFGLFQLMACDQRSAMIAEMEAQGVGKYASSDYWGLNESSFDSEEDMNTFLDIMLTYTMNEEDPTWMTELYNAQSPEEASEIFLVHYERATNGGSTIEYYAPYCGRYYQATESRREAARRWYDYFI